MRTSATGSADARGFTLVELLVVLTILTVVASLMPLGLTRALPHRRLVAAAEDLVTELRLAQAASAMAGHALEFLVADTGEYSTRELTGETAGALSHGRARVTDRFGRPRASLIVYPDGSTSGGRVELSDGAHRRIVVLSELTGRVWVEPEGAADGR
jgi:general secretion pathway protein H